MKKAIFIIFCAVMIPLFVGSPFAHADSGFIAGNIIDDNVFANKSSMSAPAVQAFLNSQVPTCDTNGNQYSEMDNTNVPDYNSDGHIERWEWGKYHYNQTVFTCLRNYSENGISAADIINNVAQQYSINPQVLVVLLQKEQGLVTDTWPLAIQYQTATGYGCPDTAPCDTQYYGLTNQLTWAAKMYRAILNNSPTWYTPYVLGQNYIQYSPNASCGGSNVNIQNRATQALYNYTPYQPNAAALAAGWGTAPCGSYGNRNFYLYFTSWFGSTHNSPYAWNFLGQAAYTDNTFQTQLPFPTVIKAGERAYMTVVAQNIGTSTWTNSGANPMRLGTSNAQDRTSVFCPNSGWITCTRPALLTQSQVAPGQIGTFGFWATAPAQSGSYYEGVNLVAEGITWLNDPGIYFPINVIDSYKWNTTGLSFYKDSAHTQPIANSDLVTNTKYYAHLTVQNNGNTTWNNTVQNPIMLAPSQPRDNNSSLCTTDWVTCSRAAKMNESSVASGGTGTFDFSIQTPANSQYVGQPFDIVQDGQRWFDSTYTPWVKTNLPYYSWAYGGTIFYTDATKSQQVANPSSVSKGQRLYAQLKVTNTSNVTWYNSGPDPVDLGTYGPMDRSSAFYDSTWLTTNRPTRMIESSVDPGQTATFEFWLQAPNTSGTYSHEYYDLVAEGKSWMKDMGLLYPFTVN